VSVLCGWVGVFDMSYVVSFECVCVLDMSYCVGGCICVGYAMSCG